MEWSPSKEHHTLEGWGLGMAFADVCESSRLVSDHLPSQITWLLTKDCLSSVSLCLMPSYPTAGHPILTSNLWERGGNHIKEGRVVRGKLQALNDKSGALGLGGEQWIV